MTSFFSKAVFSAVMGLTAVTAVAAAPKYIFYFIGDGMGPGQVMAAETYNRMTRGSDTELLMMRLPVNAMCTTWSASSPVTDSAAAGTALAAGVKTKNSMLGMGPDSVAVNSIAVDLKEMGYGIGLITNVAPDDATPGAFYAHVPYRGMYYEIGCQAAESGVDFLAGSNLRGTRDGNGIYNALYERFAANGVDVVRSLDGARGSLSRKVLLLDSDTLSTQTGHAIDSLKKENTLPAVTDVAIGHLMKHTPDRFFLMVENGNIDWAGHANDGATAVKEVICFDQALERAYKFYEQHPDETLIVVTADHETGGMSVGQASTGYNCYTEYVDCQKVSKEFFTNWCRDMIRGNVPYSWVQMKSYLRENLGFWEMIPVSEEMERVLESKFTKTFVTRDGSVSHSLYNDFPEFAQEVYDVVNRRCGFGFTTGNHSGNPVPVFAVGVGSELISGMVDNTDLPRLILRAAKGDGQQ